MTTFSYATILAAAMAEQDAQFRATGVYPFGQRVTVNALHGSYRDRAFVEMRRAVALLCVGNMRDGSLPKIGRMMHRDHSIVFRMLRSAVRSGGACLAFVAAVEDRLEAVALAVEKSGVPMPDVAIEHIHAPEGVHLQ